jgi:hypothetical protein
MGVLLLRTEADFRDFLAKHSIKTLPGLNVQEPWCSLISSGQKTIETRTYPCPASKLNIPIALIATAREGAQPAAISCFVKILRSIQYDSEKAFRADEQLHLVEQNSSFDWTNSKVKWGWEIRVIARFETLFLPVKRKGIVWAKDVLQ